MRISLYVIRNIHKYSPTGKQELICCFCCFCSSCCFCFCFAVGLFRPNTKFAVDVYLCICICIWIRICICVRFVQNFYILPGKFSVSQRTIFNGDFWYLPWEWEKVGEGWGISFVGTLGNVSLMQSTKNITKCVAHTNLFLVAHKKPKRAWWNGRYPVGRWKPKRAVSLKRYIFFNSL